jgi:PIN domain nuclease of toxin-antitoxin system
MGPPIISYLDTHTAVKFAEDGLKRISRTAQAHIANSAVLLSPMTILEMQYLFEIKRIAIAARDLQRKLEDELGARVCEIPFATVAAVALDETWTRDAFDRIIVAQAKANNFAYLVTSDALVRKHYLRAVW